MFTQLGLVRLLYPAEQLAEGSEESQNKISKIRRKSGRTISVCSQVTFVLPHGTQELFTKLGAEAKLELSSFRGRAT